jgi:hypothetical protein
VMLQCATSESGCRDDLLRRDTVVTALGKQSAGSSDKCRPGGLGAVFLASSLRHAACRTALLANSVISFARALG